MNTVLRNQCRLLNKRATKPDNLRTDFPSQVMNYCLPQHGNRRHGKWICWYHTTNLTNLALSLLLLCNNLLQPLGGQTTPLEKSIVSPSILSSPTSINDNVQYQYLFESFTSYSNLTINTS